MAGRFHSALLVSLLLLTDAAWSQQRVPRDAAAEKSFQYALQYFERASYEQAIRRFEDLAFRHPLHHRSTAALFMAACAALRAGDTHLATAMVDSLLARFPESTYVPDACIVAAHAGALRNDHREALRRYACAALRDESLIDHCAAGIAQVVVKIPPAVRAAEAERLMKEHVPFHKLLRLGIIPGASPASKLRPTVASERGPSLVALLPLTHADRRIADIARDLRDGMLTALDQFNKHNIPIAVLRVGNSASPDSIDALVAGVHPDHGIDAFLVGAFSEDARFCIQRLGHKGIPMILPSANEEDFSEANELTFQCNAPLARRAELLADYAHLVLDADEIVMLENDDPIVLRMSAAFVQRWKSHSRAIRINHWRGLEDLSSVTRELSQRPRGKGRLLIAPAMSADDIAMILRAASQWHGAFQILGMGNWHQLEVLQQYPSVDIIFESDEPAEPSAGTVVDTVQLLFRQRSGRSLTKHAMFGYDACRIALAASRSSMGDTKNFIRTLTDVFEGVRTPINFATGRVNAALSLYHFISGRIEALTSFHSK